MEKHGPVRKIAEQVPLAVDLLVPRLYGQTVAGAGRITAQPDALDERGVFHTSEFTSGKRQLQGPQKMFVLELSAQGRKKTLSTGPVS